MITPFEPYTLRLAAHGSVPFAAPCVMGILNATPDSFYADSRAHDNGGGDTVARRVERMLAAGAAIIDVGACSTRPGGEQPSVSEEMRRLRRVLPAVRSAIDRHNGNVGDAPPVLLSIDTYRATVAQACIQEYGADIINDIGGGRLDADMPGIVARAAVAYVVMHSRGTPQTMQTLTDYADNNVVAAVVSELQQSVATARNAGVATIIIDPGFGFAKTLSQNYQLLQHLSYVHHALGALPMLVGLSRKSMATQVAQCLPADALPATTALHTIALINGAQILRVHDVAAAVQACRIVAAIRQHFCKPVFHQHPSQPL